MNTRKRIETGHTGQVEMIVNNHKIANAKGAIQATGGIGDNDATNAEQFHDANGKGDLPRLVTLVRVEAALHGDDAFAF